MTAKPPICALTIHQPYPWCIVHRYKPVENRGFRPPRDLIGRWLMIHAGKKFADDEAVSAVRLVVMATDGRVLPEVTEMTTGAIVGVAKLTGVITVEGAKVDAIEHPDPGGKLRSSPWLTGPFGWVLEEQRPFLEPVPCRGMQGIWSVPEELRPQLELQWKRSASA